MAKKNKKNDKEEKFDPPPLEWLEETESPSKDYTSRHSQDQLIRRYKWKIHSRPNGKEPLWIKEGQVLKQSEVLDLIEWGYEKIEN